MKLYINVYIFIMCGDSVAILAQGSYDVVFRLRPVSSDTNNVA